MKISFIVIGVFGFLVFISFVIACVGIEIQFGKRIEQKGPKMVISDWIHQKEVEFVSGKNKLKGYIFWNAKDNKLSEKIIVLVHGYGVTYKDYEIEIEEFVKRKYSVFAYDMTGCGMSQGKKIGGFSQFLLDAQSAIKYVESMNLNMEIELVGHSTGAYAVAALLNFDNLGVSKAIIISGYSFLFNSQIYPHIGLIDAFCSENKAALQKMTDVIMSAADFNGKIEPFIECLKAYGYIGTTFKLTKHALTAFYLFLDIHDLDYHPDIVWIWFSEVKNTLGTSRLHWRRILSFCNEYLLSGDICPDRKYKYIPASYDELPEWCKEAITGLLEQKKREYRETGTLRSYRCSCTSFCLFLIDHGYDSFEQISPEIIKEYSIQDKHSTFKGRTTRFVIVRAFLHYLAEYRYTERHGLDQCLISGSAPVDKIVDVLSDEQVQRIQEYRLTHNTPVELRDIAIVLLELKTGLRACDILSLRFQDIGWKKCQISIIKKLKHRSPFQCLLKWEMLYTFYYYHQISEAFQIIRGRNKTSGFVIPEVTGHE